MRQKLSFSLLLLLSRWTSHELARKDLVFTELPRHLRIKIGDNKRKRLIPDIHSQNVAERNNLAFTCDFIGVSRLGF